MVLLQQFWTWWTSELASLLPRWDMRKKLLRNASHEIRVASDKVTVHHWKPRASLLSSASELGSGATLTEALGHISRSSRVVLTLDESMCLRRNAKLPLRESTHDDMMLQLDAERSTPFRRGTFFSLWRNARTDATVRYIDHVVIRRDYIEDIKASLLAARHRVVGIGVRANDGALWQTALSPDGVALGTEQSRFWSKSLLACLCILGASAVGAHSYVQSRFQSEIDNVTASQETLQPKAIETREAMTRIETALTELGAFKSMKRNRLSVIDLWRDVTTLLPDDIVLQSLSQRGSKITLTGSGAKPEGLIAKLEASSAFKDVRFAAPLFRAPQNEAVQFTIELTTEKGT